MKNTIMKKLQLPLKTEWFEMTKSGEKTEDYREITDFWCRRLLHNLEEIEYAVWQEMIEDLNNTNPRFENANECMDYYGVAFKTFDYNIMTLGYPKSDDMKRILKLKHNGIEIRTGNPEWGAEPNKLYFVIKHERI
jgi:hypothetical protein